MFCDILNPDGTHYEGDPRYVLKRLLKKIEDKGLIYYVGPELEYFYFKDDTCTEVLDAGGYFDSRPLDMGSNLRRETIFALQAMGIQVEYSHHEVAPSQHEIDLRYQNALKMADNTMTYRLVVKEIARQHGVYATFMPKPIFGQNGSGMHVHQSLFQGDKNAFYDSNDKYNLSQMAKHYIAGLMRHAPEITAVCNQWVNSYKRLVPGYEAPVRITWSARNRSPLIRIPEERGDSTRIELRCPDPSCNPYLSLAVILNAGLDGIENRIEPPSPIDRNVFDMTTEQMAEEGICSLPENLKEALEKMKCSKLVKDTLGEHIFNKYIQAKTREWTEYTARVTKWEVEQYMTRY